MKKPRSILLLIVTTSLYLLQGCGESTENGAGGASMIGGINPAIEVPANEQYYLSALVPLNNKYTLSKEQAGNVVVNLKDNVVTVNLKANGLDANTSHRAGIYKGEFCPGEQADTNEDGVIDAKESAAHHGVLLISLGADIGNLNRSLASDEIFSDRIGMLEYLQSASFLALVTDLRSRNAMATDSGVGAIAPNASFNFDGTILIVHGVKHSTALPESTATSRNLPPQESLPVLCGKLRAY